MAPSVGVFTFRHTGPFVVENFLVKGLVCGIMIDSLYVSISLLARRSGKVWGHRAIKVGSANSLKRFYTKRGEMG